MQNIVKIGLICLIMGMLGVAGAVAIFPNIGKQNPFYTWQKTQTNRCNAQKGNGYFDTSQNTYHCYRTIVLGIGKPKEVFVE